MKGFYIKGEFYMSKKLKNKGRKNKLKNKKENKVKVADKTLQSNSGEQVPEIQKKPWTIDNVKEAQEAAAKVASEVQEEQEFFEYVKNYTNGFTDSLQSRDMLKAEGKAKVYNRGKIEDFDNHMRLRDLLTRMGMTVRIKEEVVLISAYGSQNYSEVEKKIIYKRLNAINPEKYPDIEGQQK